MEVPEHRARSGLSSPSSSWTVGTILPFLAACTEPGREGTETRAPTPETLRGDPCLLRGASVQIESTPAGSATIRSQPGIQPKSRRTPLRRPRARSPARNTDRLRRPKTSGPPSSQASELINGATWVLVALDVRPTHRRRIRFASLRVDDESSSEGFDGCNSLS